MWLGYYLNCQSIYLLHIIKGGKYENFIMGLKFIKEWWLTRYILLISYLLFNFYKILTQDGEWT